MATTNEVNAFEGFKFQIGDLVTHVTDGPHGPKAIVTERVIVQTTGGTHRRYAISFSDAAGVVDEIELVPSIAPVRV